MKLQLAITVSYDNTSLGIYILIYIFLDNSRKFSIFFKASPSKSL